MDLIIVESPTKSKTLQSFLGPKYKVLSSYGHIRDLPKDELGIDVENNFEPKYVIPLKSRKVISELKKELEKTKNVILGTDEDREGEAIAWHLQEALKLKNPKRIAFHEITKSAIEEALKNPREIDKKLVDAQQARRILDRIVGYKLSPFLWKKVARKLSAGRVQSVAVRLVAEREKEINKLKPEEYWSIEALLSAQGGSASGRKKENDQFSAFLSKKNDKPISKFDIKTKKQADEITEDLKGEEYKVEKIEKKETKRNPFPPFTTSTLQQEAWKRFRLPAKITMRTAQHLYERGYITYHRTDSLNISQSSLVSAKQFIESELGKNYWAGFFRKYKAKGRAQEAHEAIRPTLANKAPDIIKNKLDNRQYRLYELIWQRFIASQMKEAIFDSVSLDIRAGKYIFRASGQTLKFDGFLKLFQMKFAASLKRGEPRSAEAEREETKLPVLKENEILELIKLISDQHFTQPPPRYTEASLIKALEENSIGRPSTYAPIISTIQDRNYIEKNDQKRFAPTEIGTVVNDLLTEHFPKIVDIKFTAKMEDELDDIADGKQEWVKVCKDFYEPFNKNLQEKYEEVQKKDIAQQETDKKCPKCQLPLIIRLGKFGRFYACSGFPKCKHTEPLKKDTLGIKCPKCEKAASKEASLAPSERGEIVEKRTRKGKMFYGCNQFPNCDQAFWDKPFNEKCPKCDSLLIETKRKQIKCSNKDCDFIKSVVK